MKSEIEILAEKDIKILIISRGRSSTIKKKTCRIFPDYISILVPESEKKLYEQEVSNPIETTPNDIIGLGMLRNWVLDNYKEETVVMVDDDLSYCYRLTGELTKQVNDPDEVVQIIINTAVMAKDIGTGVFGFSQTDIRKYYGTEPFILNTWVGGVIGIIGRKLRFTDNKLKVDIDFCLKNLLVNRIVFQDKRYNFSQLRDNNVGGNAQFRTKENFDQEVKKLTDKWGKCLKIRSHKSNLNINLNVPRKQNIMI